MYAAQNGHVEAVAALLEAFSVPNIIANDGQTALRLAAKNGSVEVVKKLLNPFSHGEKEPTWTWPSMKITLNDTWALIDAAEKGHTGVVSCLLEYHFDVNWINDQGMTALMVAAKNGHLDTIERLIKGQGIIVDLKNKVGVTALMLAVEHGQVHAVNLLLYMKADANIETKKYAITPLIIAAELGYTAIVHALLKGGAKVNAVNSHQMTALMLAAKNGHTDIMVLLLKNGAIAKINAQDTNNFTALMHAANNGRTESVKKLLEYKAKLGFKSIQGQTAEMLAIQFKHVDTVAVFKDHTKRPALIHSLPSVGFLPASSPMRKRAGGKYLKPEDTLCQGIQNLALISCIPEEPEIYEEKRSNKKFKKIRLNLNSSSFTKGLGYG
jgi:ankyrin repeat protein